MQFSTEWIIGGIGAVAMSAVGLAFTWVLRSIRSDMKAARSETIAALASFQTSLWEKLDGSDGFVRSKMCDEMHRNHLTRIENVERRIEAVEESMRDVIDDARAVMRETLKAIQSITALITGEEE